MNHEALTWSLYDTRKVHHAGRVAFFNAAVDTRPLHAADTNMALAGMLPRGFTFMVYSVTAHMPREAAETSELTLVVGSYVYLAINAAMARPKRPYTLDTRLVIQHEVNFAADLHVYQMTPEPFRVRIELKGVRHREVV